MLGLWLASVTGLKTYTPFAKPHFFAARRLGCPPAMKSRILRGTVGSTSVTSTTSPPSFLSTPTARRPFHSNCTNRILPTARLLLRDVVFKKRRLVKLTKHSEFGVLPESRTNFETTRALHTRNGAASIAPDLCTLHRRNLHLRG